MDSPPVLELITGLTLMSGAPPGVVCWSGRLRDHPSTPVCVLLDSEPVTALDPAFIDGICAARERMLAIAAQAAGLDDGDVARWDPELTFRAGRAWEVRFTEAPGPTELGLLVVFTGDTVTEVDDMSEWDF